MIIRITRLTNRSVNLSRLAALTGCETRSRVRSHLKQLLYARLLCQRATMLSLLDRTDTLKKLKILLFDNIASNNFVKSFLFVQLSYIFYLP